MKTLILLTTLFISLNIAQAKKIEAKSNTFGEKISVPKSGVKSVTEALSELSKSETKELKEVYLKGEIESVCKSKGCWLTLKGFDGKGDDSCAKAAQGGASQKDLRVVFKDYGFFVPKDLQGSVVLKGSVKSEKLSAKQVKHFLKDMKCSKKIIKSVKAPIYRYRMIADGLKKI